LRVARGRFAQFSREKCVYPIDDSTDFAAHFSLAVRAATTGAWHRIC